VSLRDDIRRHGDERPNELTPRMYVAVKMVLENHMRTAILNAAMLGWDKKKFMSEIEANWAHYGRAMASKEMLTFLAKGKNKKGTEFALRHYVNTWGEDTGYGVWKLSENYSAGKDVKSWRYVKMNMTKTEATDLFRKKTAETAQPIGT